MKNSVLPIFLVFCATLLGQEQVISGEVLTKANNEPIVGAVVFYDGSALGTITDIDGKFTLTSKSTTKSALVIRSLGYKTITLTSLDTDFIRVFMEPAAIELSEVTLEPDTWSRKKKLKVFKREFLGKGHRCDILNADDIRLYYNKTKKTLYAFTERPIRVRNYSLGYSLIYDLTDFEVKLRYDSAQQDAVKQVFYAGNTQFVDDSNDNDAKAFRKRKKAYFGSPLHFFRALYSNRLQKEGFQLFKRGFPVQVKEVFGFRTVDDILYVSKRNGIRKLDVLFQQKKQSFFELHTDEFIIDAYGNYAPTYGVLFGGEMGKQRIGSMLPIDYEVAY